MLETKAKPDAVDVGALLQALRDDAKRALLWLATVPGPAPCTSAHGAGLERHRRGRVEDPVPHGWAFAKAADMRRAGEVTILFQHDPDLAFVSLTGKAVLHENASDTRDRWKPAYDVYFPGEADRANAIFVEVEIRAMELWIRGVTQSRSACARPCLSATCGWRLIGGRVDRDPIGTHSLLPLGEGGAIGRAEARARFAREPYTPSPSPAGGRGDVRPLRSRGR